MIKEEGHFILGVSRNGKKFRPSDWIERIAVTCASFDASQRLRYNPQVMPAKYHGQSCLFVANSLAINAPDIFNFVMKFAESNYLRIVDSNAPEMLEPPVDLQSAA